MMPEHSGEKGRGPGASSLLSHCLPYPPGMITLPRLTGQGGINRQWLFLKPL